MSSRKRDQIFNRDGLRHYRRRYSLTEVRIGVVILAALVAIAVWVAWRGAHPDPGLLSLDPALLDKGTDSAPASADSAAARAATERGERPASGTGSAPGSASTDSTAAGQDRGPVPDGLAAAGWQERSLSVFDPDNLYVKINGRADFYLGFGCQNMYFVALVKDGDDSVTVDVEMYDLGTVANALGAYAGERQPDAQSRLSDAGIGHTSRNATFLVRGRYYVRAIGSDETDDIKQALAHLEAVLDQKLPAEPLPWGYAVFAGQMAMDPGKVVFVPANAYDFGFARSVFSVPLDGDGTEMFMMAAASPAEATHLADQFAAGFATYGQEIAKSDGVTWIQDQYQERVSGALATRSLVIGVYSAADLDAAKGLMARLRQTAASLSDDALARAAAASASAPGSEGSSGDEPGAH